MTFISLFIHVDIYIYGGKKIFYKISKLKSQVKYELIKIEIEGT
jgi:hypothetical protein